MSSLWPSVLASLDDSLALPCESVGKLEAGQSVDIDQIIQQLNAAADAARDLRALVAAELPDATWENRQGLDVVLESIKKLEEARRIEGLRSRLLTLATELEGGSIVHRRAVRVNELTQLREQAINELLTQAGLEGEPRTLPGPEAGEWIEWACALQEPDDADSLHVIREGFPQVDDFVANLEPGMWKGLTPPRVKTPEELAAAEAQKKLEAEALEERRERLLALAGELERGSVVHHRLLRVNELNFLRDQAIKELQSQAKGQVQTLPGPAAEQWIEWACSLQEPQDAESLKILHKGFARLDDFIANLEPNMWKPGGSATPDIPPPTARSGSQGGQKQPSQDANNFEEYVVSSGPIPIRLKAQKSPGGRPEPRNQSVVEGTAAVQALEPEVPVTNFPPPPRAEETVQRTATPERDLRSRLKAVTDTVRPFNHRIARPTNGDSASATGAAPAVAKERPEPVAVTEAFRATAAAPAMAPEPAEAPVRSEIFELPTSLPLVARDDEDSKPSIVDRVRHAFNAAETYIAGLTNGKAEAYVPRQWWLPVVAGTVLLLVLATWGTIRWVHRGRADNNPVKAAEKVEVPPSNPVSAAPDPSAVSTVSERANTAKPPVEKQPKTKDQAAASKPPSPNEPPPPAPAEVAALQPALAIQKGNALPRRELGNEVAPPNGMSGVAGSVPGGAPGAVPNSVINVAKEIPVAEPKVAAQKVSVSSGVAQGLLVYRVAPEYPAQAKQAHIQGTVVLQAVIGKDGIVHSVKAVRGNPVLTQAAIDAVKQWRYRPYALNGEPVEADTQISVKFTPHD